MSPSPRTCLCTARPHASHVNHSNSLALGDARLLDKPAQIIGIAGKQHHWASHRHARSTSEQARRAAIPLAAWDSANRLDSVQNARPEIRLVDLKLITKDVSPHARPVITPVDRMRDSGARDPTIRKIQLIGNVMGASSSTCVTNWMPLLDSTKVSRSLRVDWGQLTAQTQRSSREAAHHHSGRRAAPNPSSPGGWAHLASGPASHPCIRAERRPSPLLPCRTSRHRPRRAGRHTALLGRVQQVLQMRTGVRIAVVVDDKT